MELLWSNESTVILVICNTTGINYFKISFSSWIISRSSFVVFWAKRFPVN